MALLATMALGFGLLACEGTPPAQERASRAECRAVSEHIVDLTLGPAGVQAEGADEELAEALAAHRQNLLAASADDIATCEATKTSAFTKCALRITKLEELSRCEAAGTRGAEDQ